MTKKQPLFSDAISVLVWVAPPLALGTSLFCAFNLGIQLQRPSWLWVAFFTFMTLFSLWNFKNSLRNLQEYLRLRSGW